jgi:hypothetical protein
MVREDSVRPARVVALAGIVLATGCGQPATLEKQAEAVGSIAAEGALLAHDAGEGSTLGPFTEVHAQALRKKLAELDAVIDDRELARVSADVDSALQRLEEAPGDRPSARTAERELDEATEAADQIGKRA